MAVLEVQPLIRGNWRKKARRRQPHRQATGSTPDSRQKIESLRRQITRGDYDVDRRLSVSIDRLIETILG